MPKPALSTIGLLALALAGVLFVKFGLTDHYAASGTILGFGVDDDSVIIDHSEILGYMPPMIMTFYQAKSRVGAFSIGDSISFKLSVRGNESWLSDAEFISKSKRSTLKAGSIQEDLLGLKIPDIALIDQDGESFLISDKIEDRPLLLTFIYTRCPIPDYCPLMSSNFKKIDISNAGLRLMSISIDPTYDTSKVLKAYSAEYLSANSDWIFASGDAADINEFASFFGVNFARDSTKEELIHNLVTVLIDERGKVKKLWRGNRWRPSDILEYLVNT